LPNPGQSHEQVSELILLGDPLSADQKLLDALGATKGVVCLVGAGGKKTTMYALARMHSGRVLLSSTTHMYAYRTDLVDRVEMLSDRDAPLPELSSGRVVALATQTDTAHRVGGVPAGRLEEIYRQGHFEVCLIKADGARARWIKTPGPNEPLIPSFATTVIPVVSVQVLGRRLDNDIAHQPQRVANFLNMNIGDRFEEHHLIELLTNPAGSLKGVGEALVIPLINMVDSDELCERARTIALAVLARAPRISRIVLASMKHARLVDVIKRG
jgi:probable selenium-dependent hydroxylase accessory protein YqeC